MGGLTEKLRDNRYDLLTTDLKMPDISGYEVLELLPFVRHRKLAYHSGTGDNRFGKHH